MVTLASIINGRPGLAVICLVATALVVFVAIDLLKEWRRR